MKNIFVSLILLFNSPCYCANEIDSLLSILHTTGGVQRIDCLNKLSKSFLYRQTDSALHFAQLAFSEAAVLSYLEGKGDALLNMGAVLSSKGNHEMAKAYLTQSISFFERLNQADKLGQVYFNLGLNNGLDDASGKTGEYFTRAKPFFVEAGDSTNLAYLITMHGLVYLFKGKYDSAFICHSKSLEMGKLLNNSTRINYALNNLGRLFLAVEDYPTAIEYFRKAQPYIPYYDLMAESFYKMGEYDSAVLYMQKFLSLYADFQANAIATHDTSQSIHYGIWIKFAQADLFLIEKKYDQALRGFADLAKTEIPTGRILTGIIKSYLGKKDYTNALAYTRQLMRFSVSSGNRLFVRDALKSFWEIYDHQKRYDSAYAYYIQYMQLKDSITNYHFIRQLSSLKDSTAEESRVSRYKEENSKRDAEFAQKLQKESYIKKLLVATLSALVLLSVIVFFNIRLKLRNEKLELEKFNHKLNLQQLESDKKEAELRKKSSELEMQVLRTQMNPHFIFNSLNSINRFILQNNKGQASQYLTKFSKLIRLILQNSQADLITLESELESLELYLDLEALRFNYHFSYKISIQNDVEVSDIKVPPLIIQPYVENAIWHGLMHKEEKGQLDIDISVENEKLICRVTDNGIGRKKAEELGSKTATRHKSMGLHITADRIALIQKEEDMGPAVKILDLTNPDGTAAGTEVMITLPLIYA